jgi:hypothetical protein
LQRVRTSADVDRHVSVRGEDTPERRRLSEFRDLTSYVLLGEPGSGKSTSFAREAGAVGSRITTARQFVAGKRPNGRAVFIDAMEEYRIGEVGVDRLESLIDALETCGYDQWRIACRAISLPPSDAIRIEDRLGDFATLQLEPLDFADQRRILSAIGESDPAAFQRRVETMSAAALMGNPSTLLLLHDTLDRAEVPITTRGGLLAEATRQMAHEVNPAMPERSDRPPPSRIMEAAEAACLVLLLSVRTDLWMHAAVPTDRLFVTRDDLLPAHVDTQALRAALDTPMFSGDGETFVPTHRFVAEYLGGRALARATAPADPGRAALSLNRAIAFLHGDDDRPAPALTGIYAWFVTALSQTVHADRALELVKRDPEAILFHGDAAMLPTAHRRALLDAVGREDPWFLGGNHGTTALAGFARSDLAEQMKEILVDPDETANRRTFVLIALGDGEPVPELAGKVWEILTSEDAADHFERRFALRAYEGIVGATPGTYRAVLDAISKQTSAASVQLRVEVLANLVPGAAIEEIRATLLAYAATRDGPMGYARPLGTKLNQFPEPALFDHPLEIRRHTGEARHHEVSTLLDRALAAAIRATGDLRAVRLLSWLSNASLDDLSTPDDIIRTAIREWLAAEAGRELELLDAVVAANEGTRAWQVLHDFQRLVGTDVSLPLRTALVERAENAADVDLLRVATIAFSMMRPLDACPELFWRLWETLHGRTPESGLFADLKTCTLHDWHVRDAERNRERNAEQARMRANETDWYRAHLDEVRSGTSGQGLFFAADQYLGHAPGDGKALDRLRGMFDDEIVEAILTGWQNFSESQGGTAAEAGRRSASSTVYRADMVCVTWADVCVAAGKGLDLSMPTLFTVAHTAFALPNQQDQAVRSAALARIYDLPEAADAIVAFWTGALAGRARGLPFAHDLDPARPVVRSALRTFLQRRPALRQEALREALRLAALALGPSTLLSLARNALARPLPTNSRRLWAFVAFMLDPASQPDILAREFSTPDGNELFAELFAGDLGKLAKMDGDEALTRLRTVIDGLAPRHEPRRDMEAFRGGAVGAVAASIAQLSQIPTVAVSDMLGAFLAAPELAAWHEQLKHQLARQMELRRRSEFRPPEPAAVAAALAAGPPATAGDLRAIIRESIEELAEDIRHGDTSPWKGFWNRPSKTSEVPEPVNTPKIENDCRDLLTDRLADRLRRYGIPVRQVQTEDRSGDDRRADVMIVLGDGSASVPIEAKRHWNAQLWTAVEDQLLPYCRSAGSNGHGIYLVFWFGADRPVPSPPGRTARPGSAAELQDLLVANLPADGAQSISVIVVDVAEPG